MESSRSSNRSPTIYTYYIGSHGKIMTTNYQRKKKFIGIDISHGVELFTYTDLGNLLMCSSKTVNYVCKKYNTILDMMNTPFYKYTE